MLTPEQAARLRGLITRHAWCQFQVGRLTSKTPDHVRARDHAAADKANRAVCDELLKLTEKESK